MTSTLYEGPNARMEYRVRWAVASLAIRRVCVCWSPDWAKVGGTRCRDILSHGMLTRCHGRDYVPSDSVLFFKTSQQCGILCHFRL